MRERIRVDQSPYHHKGGCGCWPQHHVSLNTKYTKDIQVYFRVYSKCWLQKPLTHWPDTDTEMFCRLADCKGTNLPFNKHFYRGPCSHESVGTHMTLELAHNFMLHNMSPIWGQKKNVGTQVLKQWFLLTIQTTHYLHYILFARVWQ